MLRLIFLDDMPGIPLSRCESELKAMESVLLGFVQLKFIPNPLISMLTFYNKEITYWVYWWIIPVSQLILAM